MAVAGGMAKYKLVGNPKTAEKAEKAKAPKRRGARGDWGDWGDSDRGRGVVHSNR